MSIRRYLVAAVLGFGLCGGGNVECANGMLPQQNRQVANVVNRQVAIQSVYTALNTNKNAVIDFLNYLRVNDLHALSWLDIDYTINEVNSDHIDLLTLLEIIGHMRGVCISYTGLRYGVGVGDDPNRLIVLRCLPDGTFTGAPLRLNDDFTVSYEDNTDISLRDVIYTLQENPWLAREVINHFTHDGGDPSNRTDYLMSHLKTNGHINITLADGSRYFYGDNNKGWFDVQNVEKYDVESTNLHNSAEYLRAIRDGWPYGNELVERIAVHVFNEITNPWIYSSTTVRPFDRNTFYIEARVNRMPLELPAQNTPRMTFRAIDDFGHNDRRLTNTVRFVFAIDTDRRVTNKSIPLILLTMYPCYDNL